MREILTKRSSNVKLGRNRSYFAEREILLDLRGEVDIHPRSHWGFRCMVLSSGHSLENGEFGDVVRKKVVVKEGAWIASGAILYNCTVGEHAVVGAGAVVKNTVVHPYTCVEGNPAKVVAKFEDGHWNRVFDERGSDG